MILSNKKAKAMYFEETEIVYSEKDVQKFIDSIIDDLSDITKKIHKRDISQIILLKAGECFK